MRHRETDNRTPAVYQSFSRSSPTGSVTATTWSEAEGKLKTIDDCVLPNYQSVIARGGVLPYLPVRIESREISVRPMIGQLQVHGPPSYQASWGSHVGAAIAPYILPIDVDEHDPAIFSSVVNAAIGKAKSGEWDALTSLAEAAKSVRGIADRMGKTFDLATKTAYAVRNRRGFRRKSIGERLHEFENLWLEGRYQWRPLVGEIGDICNHLSKGTRSIKEDRSFASEDLSKSVSAADVVAGPRIWQRESVIEGQRTYRGFALAVGRIESANLRVGQTMWELVPYSFLVDKFINIGSAINAWTPVPGVDIRASGVSIRDTYTITQEVVVLDNPAQTTTTYTSSQSYRRVTKVERYKRIPSGAVVPRLYPRLKPADFLDILTLATARARRVTKLLTY